jgi:Mrp family chromosome partitioning ATPase
MLRSTVEPDPFAGDGVPFIEVGGPEGVVPELETQHLSVTFHRLPQITMKAATTGIAPELVVHHFPQHAVATEYRSVRDAIMAQFEEPGSRVALFAAAASVSGTTTVLMNLAVSLCQEHGSRVLVVDANFRKPGVARRLSCAESPGLAEVLGQSIPLAWALQPTPLTNLHVLAAGVPNEHTEEAMTNDFPRLLTQLRQWFDWVVIDGGIWNELPGNANAAAGADGVYLVTRLTNMADPHFTGLRAEITATNAPVRGYISTQY